MGSIQYGTVTNTNDPEKLGRIQVELEQYETPFPILHWLRVVQPMATKGAGVLFLPEVGDQVAMLRNEESGSGEPYLVLGCVYTPQRKPSADAVPVKGKEKDVNQNFIKQLKTKTGHELTFNDEKGKESITLKTGDQKISIQLDQKTSAITVFSDKGVTLNAPNGKVSVIANQVEIVSSTTVLVKGSSKVDIMSDAEVSVVGGGAMVKLAGGIVELG